MGEDTSSDKVTPWWSYAFQRKVMSLKHPLPPAKMFIAICETSVSMCVWLADPVLIDILRREFVDEKADVMKVLGFSITPKRSPTVSSQKKNATSLNCFRSFITISSCTVLADVTEESEITSREEVHDAFVMFAYTFKDANFGPVRWPLLPLQCSEELKVRTMLH